MYPKFTASRQIKHGWRTAGRGVGLDLSLRFKVKIGDPADPRDDLPDQERQLRGKQTSSASTMRNPGSTRPPSSRYEISWIRPRQNGDGSVGWYSAYQGIRLSRSKMPRVRRDVSAQLVLPRPKTTEKGFVEALPSRLATLADSDGDSAAVPPLRCCWSSAIPWRRRCSNNQSNVPC